MSSDDTTFKKVVGPLAVEGGVRTQTLFDIAPLLRPPLSDSDEGTGSTEET
jgi:hypothetical protein